MQALARRGVGLEPAFLVARAETVRASVALVAVHPAAEQLVGDGLGAPAHVFGDPPHRPSETREEPEPLPVFQLHVLHCRLPFFSFDRRRVADTRPRPFVGMGIVCRISRLSESKLGSPPRGGEREESSFPQQQPIFTRGKLSLKSSLLLEAAG